MYGLGAIIHLKSEVFRRTPLPFADPTRRKLPGSSLTSVFALGGPCESLEENRTRVAQILRRSLVCSPMNSMAGRLVRSRQSLEELFQVLTKEAASVPLCQAVVVKVNGIDSVVIDAEISSDEVTLNN